MHPLWIISLSLLALYLLRIFIYIIGWGRIHKEKPLNSAEFPDVSLVIPVRDEEENISLLLEDLASQEYPADAFEIIVVDDHSTDETSAIIKSFQGRFSHLTLLSLDSTERGKKEALKKGINAAIHPLILNCDGDCRASSTWIASMTKHFSDPKVRMVIGTVILEPDRNFFQSMQSLEFFSLTAVSGGACGLRDPILCSAANLAYFRADYLKFIEQQPGVSESGDDIFLMLWLKNKQPGSIRFSAFPESVIRSHPAKTLGSFILQRLRWTSKYRFYRDFQMLSTALLVFVINVLLLFLLLAGFFDTGLLALFGILFSGKIIVDFLFLAPVLKHFKKDRLLWYFLPMEMVYFMYVSLTGLFGQFVSFTWKGRRIPALKKNKTIGK